MKKKLVAGLMSLCMMIALLAGCGSQSTTEVTKDVTESTTSEKSDTGEVAGEKSTNELSGSITIWCWDETFNVPAAQKAGEIFKEAHPDVEVVVEVASQDDINTKLTAAAVSGDISELPDIVLQNDRNVSKYATLYPDLFVTLDDAGINYDDFASYKVGYNTVDGQMYGVPFDSGVTVLALRTDIISECGYTVDDFTDITWSKFIELGKDVYSKTGCNLLVDRADVAQLLNVMIQSTGSWYFDESGNVNIANNENLDKVFTVYKELVDNNIVALYNDSHGYNNALWSGTTAGVCQGCWVMSTIKKGEDQSGNWALTNIPKVDGIDSATNYSNNGGGSWMVINKENAAVAKEFLAETFAGSVELYNEILPETSAIATYLPAREAENYGLGDDFFGGQTVYQTIMSYANEVPQINYGLYSSEAYDAIATAMTKVLGGANISDALQEAEETVSFQMQ